MKRARSAFVICMAVAAGLTFAAPASADDGHPWDATWFGGFGGSDQGVQVIVAGDEVVGFFSDGDYVDVTASEPIAADGSLTFKWDGGEATLSAKGSKRLITIRETGATPKVIDLRQDQ